MVYFFIFSSFKNVGSNQFEVPNGYQPMDSSCFSIGKNLIQTDPRKNCLLKNSAGATLEIPPSQFFFQLVNGPRENPLKLKSNIPIESAYLQQAVKGCSITHIERLSDQKTFLISLEKACIFKIPEGSLLVQGVSNQGFTKNVFLNPTLASVPVEESQQPQRALSSQQTTLPSAQSLSANPDEPFEMGVIEENIQQRKTPSVQRKISSIETQQLPEEENITLSPWENPFESEKIIDLPSE